MTPADITDLLQRHVEPALVAAQEGRPQPRKRLDSTNLAVKALIREPHWTLKQNEVLHDIEKLTAENASTTSLKAHHLDQFKALLQTELDRQTQEARKQEEASSARSAGHASLQTGGAQAQEAPEERPGWPSHQRHVWYSIVGVVTVLAAVLAVAWIPKPPSIPVPIPTPGPECLAGLPANVQIKCGCSPTTRNIEVALKQTGLPKIVVAKLNECANGFTNLSVRDKNAVKARVEGCISTDSTLDDSTKNELAKIVDSQIGHVEDDELRIWQACYRREISPVPTPAEPSGCSDRNRDGFLDVTSFPNIAGCLGAWHKGSARAAKTNVACGNDLQKTCDVPADLCAAGWHICGLPPYGPADLKDKLSLAQCVGEKTGTFIAALGDQKCEPCTSAGFDAVCCGSACQGDHGSCVWEKGTPYMGIIDGHNNLCSDVQNKYPNAIGALCCAD